VRFITFETLVTGVRAFECAFSMRTSSFVHGLMTRRAVFAFTVLADFTTLTVFFKALERQPIGLNRGGLNEAAIAAEVADVGFEVM
jgi:hypothetical protein